MNRGVWQATVHGVSKVPDTTLYIYIHIYIHTYTYQAQNRGKSKVIISIALVLVAGKGINKIALTGIGRHAAKSLQSCPTLWDPRDGSPPDSPVPGILQARTLEWVAISFSNA